MAKRKEPYVRFFFSDWRADPGLRLCSLAARGLWIEMLGLMHESDFYGHLTEPGARKITSEMKLMTLCLLARSGLSETAPLLKQLTEHGVCSVTRAGVIYSRRLLRDRHIQRVRADAGRLGGKASQSTRLLKHPAEAKCGNGNGSGNGSGSSTPEGESEGDPPVKKTTQWLADLWNELAPAECSQVRVWSQERHRKALLRIKAQPDREVWRKGLSTMQDCPFLRGKARGDRTWTADIGWLLKPNSLAELLEGKFLKPALKGRSGPEKWDLDAKDLGGMRVLGDTEADEDA